MPLPGEISQRSIAAMELPLLGLTLHPESQNGVGQHAPWTRRMRLIRLSSQASDVVIVGKSLGDRQVFICGSLSRPASSPPMYNPTPVDSLYGLPTMVSLRYGGLAARALQSVSTLQGQQASSASYADNALAAAKALQTWYDAPSGLWSTTGWWNSANCLTVLADVRQIRSVYIPFQLSRELSGASCSGTSPDTP